VSTGEDAIDADTDANAGTSEARDEELAVALRRFGGGNIAVVASVIGVLVRVAVVESARR
jgi:ACR3 family arsenite efflux pump ArsB